MEEKKEVKKPKKAKTEAVKLPQWIEKPLDRMKRQQIILK